MKNKWLIILLIIVILALIGGLVFCGIKINKLNTQIEEAKNNKVEQTETVDNTTQEEVSGKANEDKGLSLTQILAFDESQVKNLQENEHVSKGTIDDCEYVRVHAQKRTGKDFVAYIDTYAAKNILNKEIPYAAYDITTPKEVGKVVCCEFGQAPGNDVYVFIYVDGTADYLAAQDVINGKAELKHFDMDNILDVFNVGIGVENGGGALTAVVVQYDGTAYVLQHNDGVLKVR